MANTNEPVLPYPDFTGLTRRGKIDAMVEYVRSSASTTNRLVTLPRPVVFVHENGSTSTID